MSRRRPEALPRSWPVPVGHWHGRGRCSCRQSAVSVLSVCLATAGRMSLVPMVYRTVHTWPLCALPVLPPCLPASQSLGFCRPAACGERKRQETDATSTRVPYKLSPRQWPGLPRRAPSPHDQATQSLEQLGAALLRAPAAQTLRCWAAAHQIHCRHGSSPGRGCVYCVCMVCGTLCHSVVVWANADE